MGRKTRFCSAHMLLIILYCCCLSGCGGASAQSPDMSAPVHASGGSPDGKKDASAQDGRPLRDSTPNVRVPAADGTDAYGTDVVSIDASHADQGYAMVRYMGDNDDVRLLITAPDDASYQYILSREKEYETFPLSCGSGTYLLEVLENTPRGYALAFSQDITAGITDEFLPFLYPNQYVFFTADSQAVGKAEELVSGAHSDLEAVEAIYHYVVQNIDYDTEKAANVTYGYVPDVDETLRTGKGICFDYASLMASMLRSQDIPTRLEIGHADEAYHAWISTYITDVGWIDGIIEFDGTSWSLMDPTWASSGSDSQLKELIGSGGHYMTEHIY